MKYGGKLTDWNRQARNSFVNADMAVLERKVMASKYAGTITGCFTRPIVIDKCENCGQEDRMYDGWCRQCKFGDDP